MKTFAIAGTELAPDESFFDAVAEISAAGVDFLLLRDKGLPDRLRFLAARRCRELVTPPTRLLVHGRADIARAIGADGVHLPSDGVPADVVRSTLPRGIVGRSCHTFDGCRAAAAEGVDYVLYGPVFAPRSKAGEGRVSRDMLAEAAKLGVDVYALGGISRDNLADLAGSGIAGCAGISLFMNDRPLEPIVEAIRRL